MRVNVLVYVVDAVSHSLVQNADPDAPFWETDCGLRLTGNEPISMFHLMDTPVVCSSCRDALASARERGEIGEEVAEPRTPIAAISGIFDSVLSEYQRDHNEAKARRKLTDIRNMTATAELKLTWLVDSVKEDK